MRSRLYLCLVRCMGYGVCLVVCRAVGRDTLSEPTVWVWYAGVGVVLKFGADCSAGDGYDRIGTMGW